MKALRLLPSAQRDLDAIWDYTAQAWGLDQAENYITALRRDMERLREYPHRGAKHASRHASFRKLPSGHHVIYYLVSEPGVDVVRVLHEHVCCTAFARVMEFGGYCTCQRNCERWLRFVRLR